MSTYSLIIQPVQFGLESADSNYEEVWAAYLFKTADENNLTPSASDFMLYQNHPNPFNPTTEIRYEVLEAAHIRLVVYDITGREVARLVDGIKEAGRHKVVFDGRSLASGVYIYKLVAEEFQQSMRMILAK